MDNDHHANNHSRQHHHVILNNGDIEDDGDEDNTNEEGAYDQADGDSSISANQIFSSAKQKQLDKEANSKTKTSVKLKTFFGGEEIKNIDDLKSMRASTNASSNNCKLNVSTTTTTTTTVGSGADNNRQSVEYFNFEFVGGGVKLEKSILIVSTSVSSSSQLNNGASRSKKKKMDRVNFIEAAETYEYPSYEFMLKEMGIDPCNDPDYQIVPLENGIGGGGGHTVDDEDSNVTSRYVNGGSGSSIINKPSYTQFLPGLVTGGRSGDASSSTDDVDGDAADNFTKLGK
jgi:hypothetical protein